MMEKFSAVELYAKKREPFVLTDKMKKDAIEKEKEGLLQEEGLTEEQSSMRPQKWQAKINDDLLKDDHDV